MKVFDKLGFFEKRRLRKIVKNAVRDGLEVKNYEKTFSLWDKIVNKFKSLITKKTTPQPEQKANKNTKSARIDFFERLDERDTVAKANQNNKDKVTVIKHQEKEKSDKDEHVI